MMASTRLSIIAITLLTLNSCNCQREPEEVLKEWLMHISHGECDKAYELEVETFHKDMSELHCEPFDLEIKDIHCEIEGDAADCSWYGFYEGSNTDHFYVKMKLVDGEWKVHEEY